MIITKMYMSQSPQPQSSQVPKSNEFLRFFDIPEPPPPSTPPPVASPLGTLRCFDTQVHRLRRQNLVVFFFQDGVRQVE